MMVLKRSFINFIIAFLCIPIAMAQSAETKQDYSAPEILSYASLCKAIYWQRVGDLNLIIVRISERIIKMPEIN